MLNLLMLNKDELNSISNFFIKYKFIYFNNMEHRLPVSIVICALNEEVRIKDTILSARKNAPYEIIVIEGGSVDKTVEVATQFADKVYSVNNYGLGFKRAFGVEKATQKYILTLDADQVLEEKALEIMIFELEKNDYVGIQTSLKSLRNETYWEQAMGYNVGITQTKSTETIIIGTPALYKSSILKNINFDKTISGSCDDTDLCYRLKKNKYKLGISSAICYQKHRSTLKSTYKKFMWYGEGDCEFGLKHSERMMSIFFHPLKNYVFKKSFKAFLKKDYKFIPFFIFTGIVRHLGFYKFLLKKFIGNTKDSRVANRTDMEY